MLEIINTIAISKYQILKYGRVSITMIDSQFIPIMIFFIVERFSSKKLGINRK